LSQVIEEDKEKISIRVINRLIDYVDYKVAQRNCFKCGDLLGFWRC